MPAAAEEIHILEMSTPWVVDLVDLTIKLEALKEMAAEAAVMEPQVMVGQVQHKLHQQD
jgi:hypothetical protein